MLVLIFFVISALQISHNDDNDDIDNSIVETKLTFTPLNI